MFDQVTLHIEGFPALGAVECLGVVMSLHMSSQVGSVSKLLTTVSTAIRLLSGVRSHMSLQQPGTTESLPAHLALVVVCVSEEVHVEGRHADVLLLADVAALHVLPGQLEVGLPVTGEVGAGGEMFAALLTLVSGALWLATDLRTTVVVEHRVHCEGFDGEDRRRERRDR